MRSFLKAEDGAAAVYFALVSPILIGFAALGAEATLWLVTERKLQHIADVAAYSGAARALSTADAAVITAAARNSALLSGLGAGEPLDVHMPPAAGAFAGQPGSVEVVVQRSVPRYLTGLVTGDQDPVVISARAVAGLLADSGEPVCMLALAGNAAPAFSVGGAGTVNVTGCAFASNSAAENSFDMIGARVQVSGSCLYTVGGADVSTGLSLTDCDAPQTMQRPTADPYAGLAIPDPAAFAGLTRRLPTSVSGSFTPSEYLLAYPDLPVALFDGGLTLSGTVSLSPGLYVIDGGTLKINANTQVSGKGVSFYLMNGARLDVNGSAALNLSAYDPANPQQRPDPFAGLLFFGDRTGTPVAHSMSGNAASNTDGVIYFPNDALTYTGDSSSAYPCLEIIAARLGVSGSGTLNIGCAPHLPPGAPRTRAGQRVALLE